MASGADDREIIVSISTVITHRLAVASNSAAGADQKTHFILLLPTALK